MSISINAFDMPYSAAASTYSGNLASKIEEQSKKDLSTSTDEELMDACKEFEAYFIEMVFKEMKKMVPESDYTDPATEQLTDYFKESMMSEYAADMADQGTLGLAQTLYEQMKRNVGEQIPASETVADDKEQNDMEKNDMKISESEA